LAKFQKKFSLRSIFFGTSPSGAVVACKHSDTSHIKEPIY
jgi:hypothetical protein